MGYLVRIKPEAGRSGMLQRGGLAPVWSMGTYYHHPSAARNAANGWVAKHPGGRAEILKFTTQEVVEIILA